MYADDNGIGVVNRMSQIKYIKNAAQAITLQGHSEHPKRGKQLAELSIIENAGIVTKGNQIVFVGPDEDAQQYVNDLVDSEVVIIDATNKIVTPGLVDPHTHIVFGGSRERELEMRLEGASYIEILKQGGGILYSTTQTRKATEEELILDATKRLNRFLLHGVTTIEAKSGYGLTVADELKQLRVAKKLNQTHAVDLVSTFMGAHAVPVEYKENPDKYVQLVIEEMLPKVAEEGLAEFCDVFCEEGVFTVEQSAQILNAGKNYGLIPKLHADEIVQFGGSELAAKLKAISADHLLKASDEGIKMMAEAGVIGVLLPGTAFFLMEEPADARKMIEAGLPIALSTDRNPGSSPTESLQLIMNLACLTMKMTPAEVISASTINAAHAINKGNQIGSLEVGKKADLVIFDAPNYQFLQYNYGVNLVEIVIKDGRLVVQGGGLVE